MKSLATRSLLGLALLLAVGCGGSNHQPTDATSTNAALFDPQSNVVPLPNVLATAMAANPLTNRAANKPMTPPEALAYVNIKEVAGTNAVSGLNAPIYLRFGAALDPASVTPATVKVFQITGDSTSSFATENNPLTFTDVSAMFSYQYTAGGTDLFLFPNFPLAPATRYLYVVTGGVKDAASGKPVCSSTYFDALKSPIPLIGPLAGLEPIRANALSGSNVQLSGYAKVMDDLITASATTGINSRADIALMGRFITTGAGYVATDATNPAGVIPVESALRAFAAGAGLGGLPGKSWVNAVNGAATTLAADYWSNKSLPGTPPAGLASVTTGSINSADLSMDPVLVAANAGSPDLTGVAGADNPAAGVVQPFRSGASLVAYYHVPRQVPFIYLSPATPNGKLVIFQHGVTGYKEQVLALAQALTGAGYAVIAIDLPLHGELAVTGHSTGALWGQDFIALGAPLATRSNVQQAAFNLDRLELSVKTGALVAAGLAAAPPTGISYVGISLGSIVGAYYLAGNTTLSSTSLPPYLQSTLNADMKGFLSVPGARLAYLLKDSPTFGPSINSGLAAVGVTAGTPSYHQFFQLTQAVVDPVDPASITTPLASGLPSRLSGRIVVQEAVGDQVIPNAYTRYFGNALGGRAILGAAGAAVDPGFDQLAYLSGTIPASFMYTVSAGQLSLKSQAACALSVSASSPSEGYFQFNQAGIDHGFLIDNSTPANTALAQLQLVDYLLYGTVVDPTSSTAKAAAARVPVAANEIRLPSVLKILGY